MQTLDVVPMETPRAKILIVDDQPANLLALEALLTPLKQETLRASSGEEALRRVLHNDFAVILMDVQMPGLDGVETAALIKSRKNSQHIPIIFLTAHSENHQKIFEGYRHGAVDFLFKPFDETILRSKVGAFVELHAREERIKEYERKLRDRDLAEQQKKSEHSYRSLIDAIPHFVWSARADGSVSYANKIWLDYAAHTREQSQGTGYIAAVHPDDRDKIRVAWETAIREKVAFDLEFRCLRASDGLYRWHFGSWVPQRDEDGTLVGWVATVTDIDARRRRDQARAELLVKSESARARAESANRTKDEFLATVSHELRNPLQAILGWTRILRSGMIDQDKLAKALETIERNAGAQAEIIEDILDISRIITGKLRLDFQRVTLAPVIETAVDSVRPTAEKKGIALEVSIDATADQVVGDSDRLQQVIWNLLSNAIKFTPSGGTVRVSLRRSAWHAEIQISDTGKGISPSFLPHVFERFRQADSKSGRSTGLGIGLAIVRHLIDLHEGSVSAESPGEGKGSTFTVRLPLRTQPETISGTPWVEASPTPVPAPWLDGLRVLVVDDDDDARELLSTVLGEYGATVSTAASTEEALAAFERSKPDVLISDIGMPREDGFSLIRRVRGLETNGRKVPAVALTGFAREEDVARALREGFQLHVRKPVDPAHFVAQVAKLAKQNDGPPDVS